LRFAYRLFLLVRISQLSAMSLIKNLAPDDMPREKLLALGSKSLSNAELLGILIGSGNRELNAVDLCRKILQDYNNDLELIARLSVADLTKYKGIGEAKAIAIVAALEIGRRRRNAQSAVINRINSSDDAYQILRPHLLDLNHEEFWIICLNRQNQVLKLCEISKGGHSATVVDAKIIFKLALEHRATQLILAHNHPSGQLKASDEDKKLTKKLVTAGLVLDIPIIDHLIFTNNGYLSFANEHLLE
jgi:DNA repair protein RadC